FLQKKDVLHIHLLLPTTTSHPSRHQRGDSIDPRYPDRWSKMWHLLSSVSQAVCDAVCSAQELSCSQDLCVSEGSVCDFTDDCGDYSDEENCSGYKRCGFEDGFCDLMQSSESRWIRTTEAPGLKHDHTNTSAHFLSLSPGTRTSADLISPFFLPSETCQ
ncbi:hypothetical protein NQZ68_039413, partial [Dissostichus eleginoides]